MCECAVPFTRDDFTSWFRSQQSHLDSFTKENFGQLGTLLTARGVLSAPVTLSFDKLTFKKTPLGQPEQTLLNGVSGLIQPGETVCVLGAPDSVQFFFAARCFSFALA